MILSGVEKNIHPAELSTMGNNTYPICTDIFRRLKDSYKEKLKVEDDVLNEINKLRLSQKKLTDIAELTNYKGNPDLYPYQRVGVHWLKTRQKGILADEQGLGKTVMAIQAAKEVENPQILVLCSRKKKSDWKEHAIEWGNYNPALLSGSKTEKIQSVIKSKFIIGTYNAALTYLEELNPDVLIIDEAHKLKNKGSSQNPIKLTKAVISLSRKASYLFLLTASPIINKPADIWTLLNMCDRNRFSSYWSFIFRFCHVEESYFGMKVVGLKKEEEDNFQRLVSEYILRRDKVHHVNKTKKAEIYELPTEHRKLYDEMEQNSVLGEFSPITQVAKITRLRQLALHPKILLPDYNGPSKIDILRKILDQRKPKKTVVFTMFEEFASLIYEEIKDDFKTAVLHGKMTEKRQNQEEESFKKGNKEVLISTIRTGGEGLNLQEASGIIFMDLHWHPAGNQHAQERIDRPGQKSDKLEIIAIKSANTIEDYIWKIIREKREFTVEEIWERVNEKWRDK